MLVSKWPEYRPRDIIVTAVSRRIFEFGLLSTIFRANVDSFQSKETVQLLSEISFD